MCSGYPLTSTNSMDVQGVSLSIASRLDVQHVSLSTGSNMDVQDVFFSSRPTPAAVWTCRVYHFSPPALCTYRVPLYTTSSMDVQGTSFYHQHYRRTGFLFPPPAVWTCRVPLSTTSRVNLQTAYQFIACSTDVQCFCNPFHPFLKCRNAGLSGI